MLNIRTIYCICLFAFLLFCRSVSFAQGTSNKGTEFWTAYMDHIRPPTGASGNLGASSMILYITSDLSTTGSVEIADGSFTQNFTVTANTVTIVDIPASAFVGSQGKFLKGIHIKAVKPIAVYAHIYASSVSGATLLLPVSTLGKDYMSINYTQVSNSNVQEGASYSTFAVIATEDNTTVEITPAEQLINGEAKGVTFTVNLQKGQVYQALSAKDLTGTHIKSVSTAAGSCKRIAVFSGSSKIGIGCAPAPQLTSDNLFQQVYATSTWGKNYLTVPLLSRPFDIFRIILSDASTQVTLNGIVIPSNQFTNGLYYEFSSTSTNVISANKPIQVVQYAVTQGEGLNCTRAPGDTGDPEMIYLSPVEQGLDKVTLYATGYFNILSSYINVVIPTSGVASFTLDGVPYTAFTPVAGHAEYSYAQIPVTSGPRPNSGGSLTSGTHTLKANTAFNAIAYGFGGAESYGYAAGTNQVDLNTHLVFTDVADDSQKSTTACSGTPYHLQLSLPYQTTRISWDLGKGGTALVQNNPAVKFTSVVDGKTLYNYEYPVAVLYPAGNYVATATVFNPVADDCGNDQEIQFFFESTAPPTGAIQAPANSCLGEIIQFTDASVIAESSFAKTWFWDFGDNTTSAEQNPKHTYATSGSFQVSLIVVDNNGCSSVAVTTTIHVNELPKALFNVAVEGCTGNGVQLTDNSTAVDGNITKWIWDFGDGSAVEERASGNAFDHVFAAAGVYTIKLKVATNSGCESAVYQKSITIHPSPVVDFTLPDACLDDVARFNDMSTIADNSEAGFTYLWDFGDGNSLPANNTSNQKNAQHKYSAANKYMVTLTVTSKDGCSTTLQKQFTVNGALPKAKFEVLNNCSGSDIVFKDVTAPSFGNITKLTWFFDYDNHPEESETYTMATMHADKLYSHNYGLFNTPASKTFHVKLIAYSGDSQTCTDVFDDNVVINANPVIALSYKGSPVDNGIAICEDNGSIKINDDKGIYQGSGIFSGTGMSDNGRFDPAVSGPGTFTINYIFTASQTGCTYATSFQVVVNPTPFIEDNEQYGMLEGQQLLLKPTVSVSSGTLSYSWSPAETLSDANIAKPYASPVESTTYTLTVTSDKGCVSVKNIYVKVLKAPVIPNAFTPNNDGINDKWDISYLDMYPGVRVDVFSRTGEKVYSSRGYAIPWDGTNRGVALPVGTYYYIIEPGSGRKTATGYVSIIK